MTCPFCEIVARRAPATIIYRDARVTAFRDAHPRAPTHLLIVPDEHVGSLEEMEDGRKLDMAAGVARHRESPRILTVLTTLGLVTSTKDAVA